MHECVHRYKARSVDWNSQGSKLASASIDKLAKIWSVDGSGQGRDLMTVAGHKGTVERVRWHPTDPYILCTASVDQTVLIWDLRLPCSSSIQMKPIGKIELKHQPRSNSSLSHYGPASVEWHPDGSALVVSEKDNSVYVYDVRQLGSSLTVANGGRGGVRQQSSPLSIGKPIGTYRLHPHVLQETHFDISGNYMVAATKASNGMGTVRIWDAQAGSKNHTVLAGHTGSCFCLRFSPCGTRLATGGADALVGLWDTSEMVCTHTIDRHTKFIRSLSFSHDSKLLASSSEEPFIDIADSDTGDKVGQIPARYGADEIAWNPKCYALAFASGEAPAGLRSSDRGTAHVTVVKLSVHA